MDKYEVLFKVGDHGEYKNINFQPPQIVGIVETDGIHFRTPKSLKYFKSPKTIDYPLNLNKGFENYKFRNTDEHIKCSLNKIENFIMKTNLIEKRDEEAAARGKCKVCTVRSVLYRVMMTPYSLHPDKTFSDWTVRVTKFNDVIYMAIDSEQGGCKTRNDSYHFKFAQYCFADSPEKEPNTDVPIDENKQTYCVYRSQLMDFDLLYSAEVNGIISDAVVKLSKNMDELNKCSFVMTKLLWQYQQTWKKNKKTLNWWLQASLANVKDIYLGFKNKNGCIQVPVQHVAVEDLPNNQSWSPDVCTRFLYKFLTTVQLKMSRVNCPDTVYEFHYDSFKQTITRTVHKGKTEFTFLTANFVEHMRKTKE